MQKFILVIVMIGLFGLSSCQDDETANGSSSILRSDSDFKLIFETTSQHLLERSGSIGPVGDDFAAIDMTLLPDNKTMHMASCASINQSFGQRIPMLERWSVNIETKEKLPAHGSDLSSLSSNYYVHEFADPVYHRFGMVRGTPYFFESRYVYTGSNSVSLAGDYSYGRLAIRAAMPSVAWNKEFVEDVYADWSTGFNGEVNRISFYYKRQDGTGHSFNYRRVVKDSKMIIRAAKLVPSATNGSMIYFVGISDAKIYVAEIPLSEEDPSETPLSFKDSLTLNSSHIFGSGVFARLSDDQQNILILTNEDGSKPIVTTALYNLSSSKLKKNVDGVNVPYFKLSIPNYDLDNEGNLFYPSFYNNFTVETSKSNNYSIYKIQGTGITVFGRDGLLSDPPADLPNTAQVTLVRMLNNQIFATVEYVTKNKLVLERRLGVIVSIK